MEYSALSRSVARLSSGRRINSASDDAAGLAVSELIRADVATLRQGSRNAHDAISMLQTSEGALSVIDDILIRMKELAEQAATESYSSAQRQIMDQEFSQLLDDIDRISENTMFNGLKLLDSSTETLDIHLGSAETFAISMADMSSAGLGLNRVTTYATLSSGLMVSDISDEVVLPSGILTISFSGTNAQENIEVPFWSSNPPDNGFVSIERIVIRINTMSRKTPGQEYDIASIYYDESTMKYGIKLTGLWGGDENHISVSYSNPDADLVSANWLTTDGEMMAIADSTSAIGTLNALDAAIQAKDKYRAKMGYMINRLESAIKVNDLQSENLLAAKSRISDVDVATEMANMTKSQVLVKAGVAMLAQANILPQIALSLLSQS